MREREREVVITDNRPCHLGNHIQIVTSYQNPQYMPSNYHTSQILVYNSLTRQNFVSITPIHTKQNYYFI